MTTDPRSDFEVLRDGLLELDPDTRHEVIETMKVLRTLPPPVAARVLANAASQERWREFRLVLPG